MKKTSRLSLGLVAVMALSGAGVALAALPASAAPSGCNSGNFCLYQGGDYGPILFENASNVSSLGTANDKADSVFNNGNSENIHIYQNINYGGYRGYIGRGLGLTYLGQHNMGDSGESWSNRISSFAWTTSTS